MMFKVLVIQAANKSLGRADGVPHQRPALLHALPGSRAVGSCADARTIWLFREKLTKAGAIKPLFERFDATLRAAGYIAMGGQIVDASLIAAPKQRNTEE